MILRLKKLAREPWENVLEEDELQPNQPFYREPDQIVSDIDPYYMVLFLEQEMGKNLGSKFKRPNGEFYTEGYIRNLKNGNSNGVTADFLSSVKTIFPSFEQDFQKFLDFTLGKNRIDKSEYDKLEALKDNSGNAKTNYCKFLVQVTGLNPAQLQDALGGVDPNSMYVDEEGKSRIHKDLKRIVNNVFDISGNAFKTWKEDKTMKINNNKIDELKKYYNLENVVTSSLTKRLKRRG